MVEFRCKRSGNTVKMYLPQDIEELRKHEGYEEIKDGLHEEKRQEASEKRQTLKLRSKNGNV